MYAKLVLLVNIKLSVLVAAVMWGTGLSLGRAMTRYDAATFLTDGKHMISNLATGDGGVMIAAVVVGLATVTVAAAVLAPVFTATTARRPRRHVLPAWPSTSCAGGDVTGRTGVSL
ncbi:hypothetical protein ACIA5D_43815 [Actinoplanes sp. NPDC051513]|uniref:hypothetical protein n=1 Tax=Actinoplanes sp. NPDC051513 TaxID=3363908 RepID=UPI00379534EE